MSKLRCLISCIFGISSLTVEASAELDYDLLIHLDAEALAEQGMLEAYEGIEPVMREFGVSPEPLTELLDSELPSYSVSFRGEQLDVHKPELDNEQGQSWGRATYIFFLIINQQLEDRDLKFYAISGGNDLGGVFLTSQDYDAALKALPRKTDWPYIPTLNHPWYGQPH